MAMVATLAAVARGDGGGEEKREGGLNADGGRREERDCGKEARRSQQKKREQGVAAVVNKDPTRALRRWSARWSETEGQREEAAVVTAVSGINVEQESMVNHGCRGEAGEAMVNITGEEGDGVDGRPW